MKYLLLPVVFFLVPVVGLLAGQALTYAALGQVFAVCWMVPLAYCLIKSL